VNTESFNTSVDSDENVDLFQMEDFISEMLPPQITEDVRYLVEDYQLPNNKFGRDLSLRLAHRIFADLKANGFRTLPGIMGAETPCNSGENDPEMWFRDYYPIDEFLDRAKARGAEGLETAIEWDNLDHTIPGDRAVLQKRVDDLTERAEAIAKCRACPLRMACLSESVTIRNMDSHSKHLTTDEFGIYGGFDFDARSRILGHVQDLFRQYKKDLRDKDIDFVDPYTNSVRSGLRINNEQEHLGLES